MVAGLADKNKPSNPPKSPFFKGDFEPPLKKGGRGDLSFLGEAAVVHEIFNLAAQAESLCHLILKTRNSKLK